MDKLKSVTLSHPEVTFSNLIEKAKIAREQSLDAINGSLGARKTKYIWLKGQSGGLDSLLVDMIVRIMCVKYGYSDDIHVSMNMPSHFNSSETKNSAYLSSQKNTYIVSGIEEIVSKIDQSLTNGIANANTANGIANINIEQSDFHKQNVQARTRAILLLQMKDLLVGANPDAFVAICNTGNLSEIKNGNFTLHGDAIGDIYLINDLYKTQIHQLASWMSSDDGQKYIKESCNFEDAELFDVLATTNKFKPSAELKENQNDSQICLNGDDYSLTDLILYNMPFFSKEELCDLIVLTHEFKNWTRANDFSGKTEEELAEMAYDKVLSRLKLSEFKNMTFPN